jgi:hypothetical protein
MSHATDSRWEELSAELERLNVRKVVIVSIFCRVDMFKRIILT